jgi:UDP-2,4-diacetamido-2,4,6-trideoxy-beta-L-altropyranose hydrolase
MNIVIRTDASTKIGSGHIMRCLTFASDLRQKGCEISFICREYPGNLIQFIEDTGFKVYRFQKNKIKLNQQELKDEDIKELSWKSFDWESDAKNTVEFLSNVIKPVDWLIVDHYGLGKPWETLMRSHVRNIMVIDDLGNREHDCDVILDQAFGETGTRYLQLIPNSCETFFGSRYALLRPQFRTIRKKIESEGGLDFHKIKIHVFFGTYDPWGYTIKFSRLLLSHFSTAEILVALGNDFGRLRELKTLEQEFEGRFHWDAGIKEMASHMASCNMAFGAPGMATWERACLGLPSAYLATAFNQVSILKNLEAQGLSVYLGEAMTISDDVFLERFGKIISNEDRLVSMRKTAMKAVDGQGVSRIISVLTGA